MSPDPRFEVLDRDTSLIHGCWKLISCRHKNTEEEASLEVTFPDSNSTESHSSDTRSPIALADECLFESEARATDCNARRQYPEDWSEDTWSTDDNTTNHTGSSPIFDHEGIERKRECSKSIPDKCRVYSFSKTMDSTDAEILTRFVDTDDGDEVCEAIKRFARANPSLIRLLANFLQEIDALRVPTDSSRPRRSSVGRSQNGDGYNFGKSPWHNRFVGALGRLFKKLGNLGSQVIKLIVNKTISCFIGARPAVGEILEALKVGLLWIVRSVVDPQGEIRAILDDSEKSKCMKAPEVFGVVAVATVGALIMSFGTAGTGPFGVGAAIVGVAATSAVVRRKPRDCESL